MGFNYVMMLSFFFYLGGCLWNWLARSAIIQPSYEEEDVASSRQIKKVIIDFTCMTFFIFLKLSLL